MNIVIQRIAASRSLGFPVNFCPPLWIVLVDGRRYDAFLKKTNATACVRRLKKGTI